MPEKKFTHQSYGISMTASPEVARGWGKLMQLTAKARWKRKYREERWIRRMLSEHGPVDAPVQRDGI